MTSLPDANAHHDAIVDRLTAGTPVVLLDFDGTLAPIVDRPGDAAVPPETRATVERLADRVPVGVVSGRDLADLRSRVDMPSIAYSGSHGFEIQLPGDSSVTVDKGTDYLEMLDTVEAQLRGRLGDLEGIDVERKRYGIAVHYRRASESNAARTEQIVDTLLVAHEGLTETHGKKVLDLRPNLDWDKGDAVEWLLDEHDAEEARAVYIGDDVTDEDAFEALRDRGIGIVVDPDATESAARYRLDDPAAVRRFLESLARRFDTSSP